MRVEIKTPHAMDEADDPTYKKEGRKSKANNATKILSATIDEEKIICIIYLRELWLI